jgi:hypothetical protein
VTASTWPLHHGFAGTPVHGFGIVARFAGSGWNRHSRQEGDLRITAGLVQEEEVEVRQQGRVTAARVRALERGRIPGERTAIHGVTAVAVRRLTTVQVDLVEGAVGGITEESVVDVLVVDDGVAVLVVDTARGTEEEVSHRAARARRSVVRVG